MIVSCHEAPGSDAFQRFCLEGIPDELPLTRQRSALSSYAVASFTCHSVTGTVSKTDEGGRAGGTLLALGVDPRIDRNRGSRSGEDRAEGKASRNGTECLHALPAVENRVISTFLYFFSTSRGRGLRETAPVPLFARELVSIR